MTAAFAIAIHGGAGEAPRAAAGDERAYRAGLAAALDAGYAVLAHGGGSLDAVATAVRTLEDDPLFNAGRGAVLAADGSVALDASIMDGSDLRAGAVSGLRRIKNPIELARRVMDQSPYVLLSGVGAEEFALTQGFEWVPNEYFVTPVRQQELAAALRATDSPPPGRPGTVGAVALDRAGNLAAATSTGGMTAKRWGRIGDSPIIGAGTYADNSCCAVSATGHGEFFIRAVVAHDICCRVRYLHAPLADAVDEVLNGKVLSLGGSGGVIALDRQGNVVMSFTGATMFRGMHDSNGCRQVAIGR